MKYLETFTKKVNFRNIPSSQTQVRLDNLRGGKTPTFCFFGLIPQANLYSSATESSTCFEQHGITEVSLTLNGTPVNGHPIENASNSIIYPYFKFLDGKTISHYLYKNYSSDQTGPKCRFWWFPEPARI